MIRHLNFFGYKIFVDFMFRLSVRFQPILSPSHRIGCRERLRAIETTRHVRKTTSKRTCSDAIFWLQFGAYQYAPPTLLVPAFLWHDLFEEDTAHHGEEDRQQREKKGGHGVPGL